MGLRQFITSLSYIYGSENVNRGSAVMRHFLWQLEKFRGSGPIVRTLSRSTLIDDEPGGVMSEVNMLGLYDFNNMNFVQNVLQGGGVFVDVGANIGSYTLVASESPGTTVLSLEPNPSAFRKLKRNVLNNARTNVKVLNVAASSQSGVLRMTNEGAAPTNRVIAGADQGSSGIEVSADTLDAICGSHSVTPTVIKIDVEGHEADVLQGAGGCLGSALACIVENGERPSITSIMSAQRMRGPFYYHHTVSRLLRNPQRRKEDSIYIGPAFEAKNRQISVE